MNRSCAFLTVSALLAMLPLTLNAQSRGVSRAGGASFHAASRPIVTAFRPTPLVRRSFPIVSPFYRNSSLFYTPLYAPAFYPSQYYAAPAPAAEFQDAAPANSDETEQLANQVEMLTEEVQQLLAQRQPVQPEPRASLPTILVFRDGHQIEVQSYAIVGDTLLVLAEPNSSKFSLQDLDLDATQKRNAERGVRFLLPSKS